MRQILTGFPDRYEAPEFNMICLKADGVICQSTGEGGTAPEGYTWEDWTTQ